LSGLACFLLKEFEELVVDLFRHFGRDEEGGREINRRGSPAKIGQAERDGGGQRWWPLLRSSFVARKSYLLLCVLVDCAPQCMAWARLKAALYAI